MLYGDSSNIGGWQEIHTFKQKSIPKGMNFPFGITDWALEKDWMDKVLMVDWLKCKL